MVTGSTSGRTRLAHRFSPKSNRTSLDDGREIELLISTDALSEGVNLQDADTLINYDLHWNPVRLIQRAGRIDRIGSENESIVIASFLPERGLERNLGMEQVLRRRIDEFLQVFGEDSRILPSEDKPDVDEMMSAYSGQALEDADASEELDGLSRHVNRILAIRRDEPERFGQIAALRLGRRSVSASERAPVVAARVGWYWTFWKGHGLGAVLPMEDLAGLDLLFQHAESGPAQSPAHAPGPLVESARNAFEEEANTFLAQRAQPKLSAAEDWILRKLNDYRSVCVATQRDLVDDLSRWVEAGQAKALVQRQGRRWKRQKLSATAVFHEIKSLYARYPGGREVLGEPEIVGIVVGSEKGA